MHCGATRMCHHAHSQYRGCQQHYIDLCGSMRLSRLPSTVRRSRLSCWPLATVGRPHPHVLHRVHRTEHTAETASVLTPDRYVNNCQCCSLSRTVLGPSGAPRDARGAPGIKWRAGATARLQRSSRGERRPAGDRNSLRAVMSSVPVGLVHTRQSRPRPGRRSSTWPPLP
jgi:hypothetical protein